MDFFVYCIRLMCDRLGLGLALALALGLEDRGVGLGLGFAGLVTSLILNNSVSIRIIKCFAVSKVTTRVRVLSFGIDTAPQLFCHSFIALSMIRCSKSAQKSAVQMCQVTTVVMESIQLVLSQFKNFLL